MYMYAIMDTINHPKERNMDKLYIVIPAYNEQDNIEQVINDWYPVIEKHNGNGQSRLIVIDDGSKDSTYEKLKQCTKTRPLLIPITKPNGGHGATVLYGYKYALKNGADYIFQTIQTARHCRKNLNRSGNEDRNMIWSSAGEKTGRMEYHVFL